jgi:hypothetical protein
MNDNKENTDKSQYADASGTGVISSLVFTVVVVIVMTILSHYIG